MEPQPNRTASLPYKTDGYPGTGDASTGSGVAQAGHNQTCSEPLEHTANGPVTQQSECLAYTEEVAGANPAGATTPLQLLDQLSRRSRAYNAMYGMGYATPETIHTLKSEDVDYILKTAAEVMRSEGDTIMHRRMREFSSALLRYVAEGGL